MKRSVHSLPPPTSLGFPAKFAAYRPDQCRAVTDITESEQQNIVINAPTGFGKAMLAPTVAVLEGARTLVLTSTKLLQSVYSDDMKSVGMVDVRGANNYSCPALLPNGQFAHLNVTANPDPRADHGPCLSGFKCTLRGGGCPRYDAIRAAERAPMVVSNYDCWTSQGKSLIANGGGAVRFDPTADAEDPPWGKFDYIFMDEMHAAANHVSSAMRIELDIRKVDEVLDGVSYPASNAAVQTWARWARDMAVEIAGLWDELRVDLKITTGGSAIAVLMKEIRDVQALYRTFQQLSDVGSGWVMETTSHGKVVTFEPVWATDFCESLLYRGIPRRVGMSATIRPAALKYVGMKEGTYDFFEYDSPFPVERRLVWQWPAVQLNYKTEQLPSTQRALAAAVDKIRADRMDRRILLHSFSYKRMQQYANLTADKRTLVIHDLKTFDQQRERFLKMCPAAFCSPRNYTGYDYSGEAAETGVIMKTPYPPMDTAVMRARVAEDRSYPSSYAADQLMQASGRTCRYGPEKGRQGDRGDTIIPDSSVGALFKQWELFAKWYRRAWKFTREAPKPAPKLRDR